MSTRVKPDQFEISNEGITHKPTGARFRHYPGQPSSGNLQMGQLGEPLPGGENYSPDEVTNMMKKLWGKHVVQGE